MILLPVILPGSDIKRYKAECQFCGASTPGKSNHNYDEARQAAGAAWNTRS